VSIAPAAGMGRIEEAFGVGVCEEAAGPSSLAGERRIIFLRVTRL
jgi:hypothetical protein